MPEGPDPYARKRAVDAALEEIDGALQAAKRGDFVSIEKVIPFVCSDYWEVTDAASEALERLGPVRALDTLAKEARGRINPIYALAAVGTPAVVPHLIALLGDEEFEFREHARAALFRVLGDRVGDLLDFDEIEGHGPDEEREKVTDWWAAHASEFDPGIVYRHGEPLDLGRDIETMAALAAIGGEQELAAVEAMAEKIADFTGHHIENVPSSDLGKRWQEWWRQNSSRFRLGKRYFYGHLVE